MDKGVRNPNRIIDDGYRRERGDKIVTVVPCNIYDRARCNRTLNAGKNSALP